MKCPVIFPSTYATWGIPAGSGLGHSIKSHHNDPQLYFYTQGKVSLEYRVASSELTLGDYFWSCYICPWRLHPRDLQLFGHYWIPHYPLIRCSLVTRRYLVRVCKNGGTPFLYRSIFIGRRQCVITRLCASIISSWKRRGSGWTASGLFYSKTGHRLWTHQIYCRGTWYRWRYWEISHRNSGHHLCTGVIFRNRSKTSLIFGRELGFWSQHSSIKLQYRVSSIASGLEGLSPFHTRSKVFGPVTFHKCDPVKIWGKKWEPKQD